LQKGESVMWKIPTAARAALLVPLLGSWAAAGRAQSVTEFTIPTAGARPQCMAPGADGNVWVAERMFAKIGRVTPSGAITEFPAGGATVGGLTLREQCITKGPDGNLWFTVTETTNGQIGKITPTGVVTVFPTIVTDGRLYSITAGSDGALWFTNAGNSSHIVRITTDGTITEYPTPTNAGFFNTEGSITAGPDGNLWFAENNANKIGRLDPTKLAGCAMTPTICMTEFVIPTASSGASAITAGPDGALWFTEKTANKIGRITTAGVVTNEFAITTAAAGANDITTGPDGNLWFTEEAVNKIGKMTTSGIVTEIAVPTASSQPEGIALGPDGNIWFSEYSASKIGRVNLTGGGGNPTATPTPSPTPHGPTPTPTPTGTSGGAPRGHVTPLPVASPRLNENGRQ